MLNIVTLMPTFNYSEIIEEVQIGNVATQSTNAHFILITQDYRCQHPARRYYSIEINTQSVMDGVLNLYNARACKIFMDWNDDGDFFDAGETVYQSFAIPNDWTITFNTDITVPNNVQCTNVRTELYMQECKLILILLHRLQYNHVVLIHLEKLKIILFQ